MSDPEAMPSDAADAAPDGTQDSALDDAGAAQAVDSLADGQDVQQGDQSKRVNDLMSLANKRLSERDQALAEVEALRAQLDAETLADQQGFDGESQIELMHPGQYADSESDFDPMEPPEPPVITMPVNPMRPDHAQQPYATAEMSNPSARYVRDRAEIAAMKTQLNALGQQWFEGLKEQGLIND